MRKQVTKIHVTCATVEVNDEALHMVESHEGYPTRRGTDMIELFCESMQAILTAKNNAECRKLLIDGAAQLTFAAASMEALDQ